MPEQKSFVAIYGAMLRNKRERLGLSQGQAAKLVGYTNYQQLSRVERGATITVPTRKSLDRALGITETDYAEAGIEFMFPLTLGREVYPYSQVLLESVLECGDRPNFQRDLEWLNNIEKVAGFSFDKELCLMLLSKRASQEEKEDES
ncbi:MAG: helix-turn-helix transcriptional regulator [bacterium]